MPTNTSEASSSGWRRASVAGSSRRRRTDRACDRTVADISSLRAFTDLLDAAADDGEVPTRRRLPEQMGPAELRRALGEADAQNDGLSSENARLREEVTRLEGMVDALMLLVDRHGIDAEANDAGESKETALKVVDVDAETNDRAEVESSRPIGDCDSMLEHWLENHCVPAAETHRSGNVKGHPRRPRAKWRIRTATERRTSLLTHRLTTTRGTPALSMGVRVPRWTTSGKARCSSWKGTPVR